MTANSLAEAYLEKCVLRLEILHFAFSRGGYSDVVREAQELVELALKGILRAVGIDPPKVHEGAAHCFPTAIGFQRIWTSTNWRGSPVNFARIASLLSMARTI